MVKITKEEFDRTAPHYCQCKNKCGQEITWKPHYKYYGIPKHVFGHVFLVHGDIVSKEEFNKLQPRCQCPCNQLIPWNEKFRWRGIPNYVWGHQSTKNKSVITEEEFNDTGPYYCKCKKNCGTKIEWNEWYKYRGIPNYAKNHCSIVGDLKPTKGKPSWNKGKKCTEETRRKMSYSKKGKYVGENHPNWQGGITSLYMAIRNSDIYYEWRLKVMERDNYTCSECNIRGGDLEAHHIILFSVLIKKYSIKTVDEATKCDELWYINNGKTMCSKCHREHHSVKNIHN